MKKFFILVLALAASVGTVNASDGALSGKFTIKLGKQIVFSQGNLQYVGTWQFATNQWDRFGTSQSNTHRDLFCWGTGDEPNKTSTTADYSVYHEWGANPITNGGNEAGKWRTLDKDEWLYLFRQRTNAAKLFGLGTVKGVEGVIILPDDWTKPEGASFTPSTEKGMFWSTSGGDVYHGPNNHFLDNTYDDENQWKTMQDNGAVFLPAAYYDNWNLVWSGVYWSASPISPAHAYSFDFEKDNLMPQYFHNEYSLRYCPRAVRLVQSAPSGATAIDNVQRDKVPSTNKILRNGQLFIEKDGKTYTVMGQIVR